MKIENYQQTDILIIGAGLAGGIAAITAADAGRNVIILCKSSELKSGNTPHAQGGIIYTGPNDSPEKLKADILSAGAGHCWEPAVNLLCQDGPKLVKDILIKKLDIDFDIAETGNLHLTAEGAHSVPRIIHSKDRTGSAIQTKLIQAIKSHSNITILTDHIAVDLLTLSHHSKKSTDIYKNPTCFGAVVLNSKTCEMQPILAKRTIIATGGLGQIYLHTSNSEGICGDGIAMAWRAGAKCINLQYIQFHPTTLFHESGRFLISEAMRGEGARLIDKNGNSFMRKFHKLGSLAPRDIVARSIHQTMLNTNHPCVYLDITHKNSQWIKNRFPGIYANCLKNGIDIITEQIPVVPAEHYSCGGVAVGLTGKTSLQRLYAIGETSCTGVHGANRLASTSLLECLVWGYNAGRDALKVRENDDYFPDIEPWFTADEIIDSALILQDWQTIKSTMWNYVGLVRTRQRLHRAKTILRNLQIEVERYYRNARLNKYIIELRNGLQTAIAVVDFTLEARGSRGVHYLLETDDLGTGSNGLI